MSKIAKSVSFSSNVNNHLVHVPEEIFTEILIRLPVKSLLRFRSVSKSWNSIIASPGFVAKHLHHKKSSTKNRSLLLFTTFQASLFNDYDNEFSRHSIQPIPPLFLVRSSCDGLLCFYNSRLNLLYNWNPATRRGSQLPSPLIEGDVYKGSGLSFGFHPGINDYKVVKLTIVYGYDLSRTEAEIYSFESKSWKNLGIVKEYEFSFLSKPTVLNGTVYWVYGDIENRPSMILSFDIGTEIFGDIHLPGDIAFIHTGKLQHWFTSAMGESLGLVCFDNSSVGIWISDFSKPLEEVWTRRYEIKFSTISALSDRYKAELWPLGFRNNGDFLFITSVIVKGERIGKLVSCNLESQEWEKHGIFENSVCYLMSNHVESLVPISQS